MVSLVLILARSVEFGLGLAGFELVLVLGLAA